MKTLNKKRFWFKKEHSGFRLYEVLTFVCNNAVVTLIEYESGVKTIEVIYLWIEEFEDVLLDTKLNRKLVEEFNKKYLFIMDFHYNNEPQFTSIEQLISNE